MKIGLNSGAGHTMVIEDRQMQCMRLKFGGAFDL